MKKWMAMLTAAVFASVAQGQGIIDGWDFNVADGGLSTALSISTTDSGSGGSDWKNDGNASVSSGNALFERNDAGNYFDSAPVKDTQWVGASGAGILEMEFDVVSVDWALTAAADTNAYWSVGVRGSTGDMLLRFERSGRPNVTNATATAGVTNVYADADHVFVKLQHPSGGSDGAWKEILALPGSGTQLSNANFRVTMDLESGVITNYYTLDGGSEVTAYIGTIDPDWAVSDWRMASFMTRVDQGWLWQAGDTLRIDNLVYTEIKEPAPPPALTVIDFWDYESNADGDALVAGVSSGYVGGVSFNNADIAVITNNMLLFQHTSTNVSQDSLFRTATPSLYAGATTGIYELAWDYVASDFSITDASNTTGNAGMTVRDTANGNVSMGFRLRFDGNDHLLQMDDANGNNQTMATFPGSTLSNLSVRLIMDLSNSGSAGSAALLYSLDGGTEIAATYAGKVHPSFELSEYRMIVQTVNGGNGWQLGDTVWTDNLRFEKVAAMPVAPVYSDLVVYEMNDTVGTVLNALAQTGSDGGQFFGVDSNIVANGLGSLVVSGDGTNDFYRTHTLDFAYTSGLHRLVFAFDDWNLDATEDASSVKFGFQDSSGTNNVMFGIDVNTNNATVRFRAAANNGGGAGQDFYDYAGYVASTGVVLRIDVNLDAGTYSALWRYDNQTDDDYVAAASGESLGLISDIAQVRFQLNAGAVTGMDPADYVNVDYLRYSSTATLPTPADFYNAWLASYPTLGSLTNLADNKDGDALDNLGEYAFGGDPDNAADIGYAPNMGDTVDVGGTNYILHVYQRRIDSSIRGLSHWIELDTDLVYAPVFTNDTSLYTFHGAANVDDTWRSITNRVNAEAGVRFIRTRVSFTP